MRRPDFADASQKVRISNLKGHKLRKKLKSPPFTRSGSPKRKLHQPSRMAITYHGKYGTLFYYLLWPSPPSVWPDASWFRFYCIPRSPSGIQREIKDCLDTAHVRSCLIRNLASKIEEKSIKDKMRAERMHRNSIFEQHIIDLLID
jgi:hypothetical protein